MNKIILKIFEKGRVFYKNHKNDPLLGKLLNPIAVRANRKLSKIRNSYETGLEHEFERICNYDTTGYKDPDNSGVFGDAHCYAPIRYSNLDLIFDKITLNKDDVFIDIGCGKGRVVFYTAQTEIKKAIGIELSKELSDAAQNNAKHIKTKTPIEILNADAALCDLSEGTVFYFYNPFSEETFKTVIDNIRKSLITNPRKIKIIYILPECAKILDDAEWLAALDIFPAGHEQHERIRAWESKQESFIPVSK